MQVVSNCRVFGEVNRYSNLLCIYVHSRCTVLCTVSQLNKSTEHLNRPQPYALMHRKLRNHLSGKRRVCIVIIVAVLSETRKGKKKDEGLLA